jgi:3-hydroxyacyl-CoA dehydrogenase/3a,7a,12a-trihydroxy-5b-cholest-24-enoyl-CoA hydratase
MTETVMAKEMVDALKPDYVVPLVAYLAHESTEETGGLFEVGAGFITKHRFQRTKGHSFDFKDFTPEKVREHWNEIVDWKNAVVPESLNDTLAEAVNNIERNQKLTPKKTAGVTLKSEEIFAMMGEFLARGEGKDIIGKV